MEEETTWELLHEFIDPSPSGLWYERPFADPSPRSSETDRKHATFCLSRRRQSNRYTFLPPGELHLIAEGRVKPAEHGLSGAGVYIFVRLAKWDVLKVGKADDFARRIAQHVVKKAQGWQHSEVRELYQAWGEPWPKSISAHELTLLAIHLADWDTTEILTIERGLNCMLHPLIGS